VSNLKQRHFGNWGPGGDPDRFEPPNWWILLGPKVGFLEFVPKVWNGNFFNPKGRRGKNGGGEVNLYWTSSL